MGFVAGKEGRRGGRHSGPGWGGRERNLDERKHDNDFFFVFSEGKNEGGENPDHAQRAGLDLEGERRRPERS